MHDFFAYFELITCRDNNNCSLTPTKTEQNEKINSKRRKKKKTNKKKIQQRLGCAEKNNLRRAEYIILSK